MLKLYRLRGDWCFRGLSSVCVDIIKRLVQLIFDRQNHEQKYTQGLCMQDLKNSLLDVKERISQLMVRL